MEKLCVRELEKLSIPPIEKIKLYQDFSIDPNLLHHSYIALTIRAEPLDMDEGNKLGLQTSLKIARARELARTPDGATDIFGTETARLKDSAVQTVVINVFGLQEPVATQVTNQLSCHQFPLLTSLSQRKSTPPPEQPLAGKQHPTNDEGDKTSAKSRKNSASTGVSSVIIEGQLRSQTKRSRHTFIGLSAIWPTLFLLFLVCYF